VLGTPDLCKSFIGNTVNRASPAHGLTVFTTDIISFIASGLIVLNFMLCFGVEVPVCNKVHFLVLVGPDEVPQVEEDRFLVAGRAYYFIFGFDGGSVLLSEEGVGTGIAWSVGAAEVDRFDGCANTDWTLVGLHNGYIIITGVFSIGSDYCIEFR